MAKIVPIRDGEKIRLPGPRDRITIVGATGSGKTVAALWHLSNASFDVRPWIVIDPKRDDNIAAIEGAEEIQLWDPLPTAPGIYVVHPIPSQADHLDDFLMRVWEHENIGVWSDEGYMCGDGNGLTACLTQGRSKKIPMILLCQRPVFVSRFCFSEATFVQIFDLNDKRDQKTVQNFAPQIPLSVPLPAHHSWYWDAVKRKLFRMTPVPPSEKSLETIAIKLDNRAPVRRYI